MASYWRRYQAQLIDVIVESVGWGIGIVGLLTESVPAMILLFSVGIFVLPGTYETWMVARSGQTIGKRVAGIRVIGSDGKPVGWVRAAIRYLFKFAAILPPVFILDGVSYFSSLNNQTLHDRVAGTVVVRTD